MNIVIAKLSNRDKKTLDRIADAEGKSSPDMATEAIKMFLKAVAASKRV